MRAPSGAGSIALGTLLAASASAAAARVPVALTARVGSGGLTAGQPVRLTATARLPRGARLLIRAGVPGGPSDRVAECPRSPCSAVYRAPTAQTLIFQAAAIRRRGRRLELLGRSRRVVLTWRPPAPPPAATPGHYAGTTADHELWAFDVGPDGLSLSNLQTGQINESCTPPAYLSGGNLAIRGPVAVARDGSFALSTTIATTIGGSPATDVVTISGRIAGGSAAGAYRVETSFTLANGTSYACSSGDQTWTAVRT